MKLARLIPAFVFCLAALPSLAAVPTQVSAGAAEVREFVAVSATVGYAGTIGGGLWKTTDSGATWAKLTALPARTVWKVGFNPNGTGRLYAATDSGLFRSVDAGASWTQLTRDPVRSVAVSPGSPAGGPDTVLFGVKGSGILRSTDSGATIVRQSSGLDSSDVIVLAFYPGSSTTAVAVLRCNIEDAPNMGGNFGGVFRTTTANAGTLTWSAMNAGLPNATGGSTRPCVNALAVNGNADTPILVAGIKEPNTALGATYYITGVGTTWTISPSAVSIPGLPFGIDFLGPDFSSPNGFFAGTHQFGPYYSANGGQNFTSLVNLGAFPNDGELATETFAVGAFTPTVRVAGINGIGLYRTTSGGSPWAPPTTPIRADRVNDLTNHNGAAPSTYYMAVKNGGVWKSTDAGGNWAQFNQGLHVVWGGQLRDPPDFIRNVETIAAHPNNGNIVAAAIRAFGLYQLTGGTTWAEYGSSGCCNYNSQVDHKPQSLAITPAGRVFYSLFDPGANSPGGLHTSTATGTTIGTLAPTGIPFDPTFPGLGVSQGAGLVRPSPTAPTVRLFFQTYGSRPYRTMDGGTNWARVTAPDSGFEGLAFFDITERPGAPLTLVASTNKGIYRSTDDGANFARIAASGLTSTALRAVVYHPTGNVLFGGDFNGQLYCSTNDGTTWVTVTGGNFGAGIKDMKFINNAVHILTDGAGVWKKDQVCP